MARKRVCLYDVQGPGLIIEWPTNLFFYNQVGGNCCLQPEYEGFYVPIYEACDDELYEFFQSPAYTGNGGWRLLPKEADAVENILKKHAPAYTGISIDRARTEESTEAWIHVILAKMFLSEQTPLEGFDAPVRAVLTWQNSD